MGKMVISFDVDGTLTIQGEALKQAAWDVFVRGKPTNVQEGLFKARRKYSDGGGSRYDIIRDMLSGTGISGDELERQIEDCVAVYQGAVMSLIRDDFRPEVRTALTSLHGRYKLYINSATEEEGLRKCLSEVNLSIFFEDILGYPKDGSRKKVDNLRLILQRQGIGSRDLVHVGDSTSDYDAAQAVGCLFIGMVNNENRWISEQKPFAMISSLADLPRTLESVL